MTAWASRSYTVEDIDTDIDIDVDIYIYIICWIYMYIYYVHTYTYLCVYTSTYINMSGSAPAETSVTLVICDENIFKKEVKCAEDSSVRNASFADDVFGNAPQI